MQNSPKKRRGRPTRIDVPVPFHDFLVTHVRTRSGPFSFHGHKVLIRIAEALAKPDIPRVDILKATQIGLTTLAGFGYGLWEAAANRRNVGYYLPTDKMARELAGERLRHAAGDKLAAEMTANIVEGIVRVAQARIYVRGLHTILGALSVPLDVSLYDEVDDLNREHFLWARQRLDGSSYAREIAFACGRFPGEGIDARFQEGTQEHRHLTCPACGLGDQVPELLFPDNVQRVQKQWQVVCTKCGAALDVEEHGRWVAHYPGRRDVGVSFRVSALSMPFMSLDRLMREWQATERERRLLAPFRCSKLALPDAADRQALTSEDLKSTLGCHVAAPPRLWSETVHEPTFVGIDTGDWCHLAAAVLRGTDKCTYVMFEKVRGEDLIERLKAIDERCRFAGLLIDQRPEGSLARAVCRAFPGVSYLQQFSSAEGVSAKVLAGESFPVLTFDREDTLSEWCDLVRHKPPRISFPWAVARQDGAYVAFLESDVACHILAGAQRIETTDTAGYTVHRFRSGSVENHYFMACVFAWRIAEHVRRRYVSPREIGLVGRRVTEELR